MAELEHILLKAHKEEDVVEKPCPEGSQHIKENLTLMALYQTNVNMKELCNAVIVSEIYLLDNYYSNKFDFH